MDIFTGHRLLLPLLAIFHLVAANVEKAIFLGPEPVNIPLQTPSLADLNLHTLTPKNNTLRTELGRVFPKETPRPIPGKPTWLLLDNLTRDQRYEARVCWTAIEPTSFTLDVFELGSVWSTPDLIQSLAEYAASLQSESKDQVPQIHQAVPNDTGEKTSSVLLLRVVAAAGYFTDNADLMRNPPPVLVDLILDPFLYNVLPRSLVPTAGYIVAVAIVTWFVARWIASYLQTVAAPAHDPDKKRQ